MNPNKYINPFSGSSENLTKEFDRATISKDADKIESVIEKALELHNSFGMGLGNLGRIYQSYAELDFDEGRQEEFHYFACQKLYTPCILPLFPSTTVVVFRPLGFRQ